MKRGNVQKSRALRRSETIAEKKLWDLLRNRQLLNVKFRRQFSVSHYIIDFYSPKCRLGIEADGGQHYDEDEKQKDEIRTEELSKFGIKILRFSDYEILNNIEGVVEVIQEEIGKLIISPHLDPLPRGERRGVVG
jgi:very-short-patch-repair endonuclease